jgi:hypothetical protein
MPVYIPINFWMMPEPIFMSLSMSIMSPEAILTTCFLKSFHQSACLSLSLSLSLSLYIYIYIYIYIYTRIIDRHRLGKIVTPATNTHAIIEELLGASFYVRSVSH